MLANVLRVAFVAAALCLLGAAVTGYRLGKLSRYRFLTVAGPGLIALGYGLVQVSQDGPVTTGTPLNYAFDGLEALCLVGGLYALYRRSGFEDADDGTGTSEG